MSAPRTDFCGNCSFFEEEHKICHRHPPTTTPLIVPTQPTPSNPQGIGIKYFTAWAGVQPGDWCGEHEARSRVQLLS